MRAMTENEYAARVTILARQITLSKEEEKKTLNMIKEFVKKLQSKGLSLEEIAALMGLPSEEDDKLG